MPVEPRRCPPEFQDRLTRVFGTNRFHKPNYRFVWGQSNLIRLGNVWRDPFGNERRGYRDAYQSNCMPCWIIQRCKLPEEYGTPELYYLQNWDEHTRMYTCGEYPWTGRYESVMPLYQHEFVNGKMVIDHFELTHILIDTIMPIIVKVQALSIEQQEAAYLAIKAAEEAKKSEEVAEKMMESLPTYYGPVSFRGQGCRTSLLDRKMEAIQKQWNRLSRQGRRPKFIKGFQQANRPTRTFVN